MCGICGIFEPGGEVEQTDVLTMREVMRDRGPDDCGVFLAAGIGLGHRRLSILDLSVAGRQPMCSPDGKVQLVFNGEIYNFPELRQALGVNHRFKSQTDTEVLLHGYEQWGIEGLLERIGGAFALAVYDARAEPRLILVRDRLGKKPLFYLQRGRRLWFASDVKAIWLVAGAHLSVDPLALDQFLFYYYVDQDRCIWRPVRKLPPGHWAEFAAEGDARVHRYWDLSYANKTERSDDEALEELEAHLAAATRRRMIADVPLGAFLSGGVDSSSVVATMAAVSGRPVRTISVGFDYPGYDERPFSRAVAAHLKTDHTELNLRPDVWRVLPRLVWHYGEPYGDSSAVPLWFASEAARQVVTVVLTGDGGDETFGGYAEFKQADRHRRYRWLPRHARRWVLLPATRALAAAMPFTHHPRRWRLAMAYLAGRLDLTLGRSTCWDDRRRGRLYDPAWAAQLAGTHPSDPRRDTLARADGPTPTDHMLYLLIKHNLPSDYLVKVDVGTMAHSLEARSPFLDHALMQFAATIPVGQLLAGGERKHLLKRFAAQRVPPDAVYRRKAGFAVPIDQWLRHEWYGAVRRLLLSAEAAGRGMFQTAYVDRILRQHRGGANHKHRIWTLLLLEIWHRLFIDRTLQPDDVLPLE
jgi:asparagine synthase (glutamine-hydrolysing)